MFTKIHRKMVSLGFRMGALPDKEGRCVGFAAQWIEHFLLDNESAFERRITSIIKEPKLPRKIREVKNKVREGKIITPKEQALFDMLAFYDGLQLYYVSDEVHGISNQTDIASFSRIGGSEQLAAKGFLKEIYREPIIYTKKEIETHLNALAKVIDKTGGTDKVGFMLNNAGHAIAIAYNPKTHRWSFMDINQWKKKQSFIKQFFDFSKRSYPSSKIAVKIQRGFSVGRDTVNEAEYTAFSMQGLVLGQSEYADALTNALSAFKNTHPITFEMSQRAEAVNLLYIAVKCGCVDEVKQLLRFPDVNLSIDNPSAQLPHPLIVAILIENLDILKQLITYHPAGQKRVDYVNEQLFGQSPLSIAAAESNLEVVKLLLSHGANPNTPVYMSKNELLFLGKEKGCSNRVDQLLAEKSKSNKKYDASPIPIYPTDDAWLRGKDKMAALLASSQTKAATSDSAVSFRSFRDKYKAEIATERDETKINHAVSHKASKS